MRERVFFSIVRNSNRPGRPIALASWGSVEGGNDLLGILQPFSV
jgi:hypothetical protein